MSHHVELFDLGDRIEVREADSVPAAGRLLAFGERDGDWWAIGLTRNALRHREEATATAALGMLMVTPLPTASAVHRALETLWPEIAEKGIHE